VREKLGEIHRRLLKLYGPVDLSRERRSPFDSLILTVLSQNTNDELRDRAFASLKKKFPAWEMLLDATLEELEAAIKVAGLSGQKARTIKRCVEKVYRERGNFDLSFLGKMAPEEAYSYLRSIKGVGDKTAAVVLLFNFGMKLFPVDTHVARVTKRLGLVPEGFSPEKVRRRLEEYLEDGTHASLHLNLIRLGRSICKSRRPVCAQCPLEDLCEYAARVGESI